MTSHHPSRRAPHALALGVVAACVAGFLAAPARAAWEGVIFQSPTTSAPYQDVRGFAAFSAETENGRVAFYVATYNNRPPPDFDDSAVVLYDVDGNALASKIYSGRKAKSVEVDDRGIVYVALSDATVDVLQINVTEGTLEPLPPIDLGAVYPELSPAPGRLEGVAIHKFLFADPPRYFLFVTEREPTSRLYALDVTDYPLDPGSLLRHPEFASGEGVMEPFAPSDGADLRGLDIDANGNIWLAVHGRGQVRVISGSGEILENATFGNLVCALDVAIGPQYAYVTSFAGEFSQVYQIPVDVIGDPNGRERVIDVLDPTYFDAPKSSGGLTGIDLCDPFGLGQDALYVGVEQVQDALRAPLGGRDLVVQNGLPSAEGIGFAVVPGGVGVSWTFQDGDPGDFQTSYVLQVFSGPNCTGSVLFKAATTTAQGPISTTVVIPVGPSSPIPGSVCVAVSDGAILGNQSVVNVPDSVSGALLAGGGGGKALVGGACSLAGGGGPGGPWDSFLPWVLVAIALGASRTRRPRWRPVLVRGSPS